MNGNAATGNRFKHRANVVNLKQGLLAQYGDLHGMGCGMARTQQRVFASCNAKMVGKYYGLTLRRGEGFPRNICENAGRPGSAMSRRRHFR
ncbi:MAG TPA: hypothetical protein VHY79_15775 [Rhizomicrobium sp.]|jgi:hypothetical protein|nr:hypothetical protein [Rhizomicrobium sp.]